MAAVAKLPRLGELLAVIDSLRAGDIRVRSIAAELLATMLRDESNRSIALA